MIDRLEKFIARISFSKIGCWEWKGGTVNGYGYFNFEGKYYRAHRASYLMFRGPIPTGLFVCHHCDNRSCCNPYHLFLGTAKDNTHDMMKKGRNMHKVCPETLPRGDRNGGRTKPESVRKGESIEWHKLSNSDVMKIRELYYVNGFSARELAGRFGVIRQTVEKIVGNYTWKHLPNPWNESRRKQRPRPRNGTPSRAKQW
jgi:HNH endonuclease